MGKAKLIHLINEAWLKCEAKRMYDGKINSLCLAIREDEVEDVNKLVHKYFAPIEENKIDSEEYDGSITEPAYRTVFMVTEEWFKHFGYIPHKNYDSVLFSHGVHDIFFKSELFKNLKE